MLYPPAFSLPQEYFFGIDMGLSLKKNCNVLQIYWEELLDFKPRTWEYNRSNDWTAAGVNF
jgi:hypothetical protein